LLNLFPIPVLDGGHLLFHAYEAVAGKPPSEKALRLFMTAGPDAAAVADALCADQRHLLPVTLSPIW
jgi:Zn-dependent protease